MLYRVPSQLHPLPEDLRATGRIRAISVPLWRLQSGLQNDHALQVVGGTHPGSGVDSPPTWKNGRIQEGRKIREGCSSRGKTSGRGDGGLSFTVGNRVHTLDMLGTESRTQTLREKYKVSAPCTTRLIIKEHTCYQRGCFGSPAPHAVKRTYSRLLYETSQRLAFSLMQRHLLTVYIPPFYLILCILM